MERKSVGRKKKLSEEEVRTVIKMYKENIKPMGNIAYSEIHSYANQLYTEGIVSNTTSDSFWRKKGRLGRDEIDKANVIFTETVTISKGKKITIPNMVDLVDKQYKNKEELLKHLVLMEKQFHESLSRENELEIKLSLYEETIQGCKDKLRRADVRNEKLQELVYRLFRILSETKNEEVKKQTEYAMQTVFSSPTAFLESIKQENTKEETVTLFHNNESNIKFSNRFRK